MQHLFSVINRIAPTNSSVMITGETGTGKELVARTIHERSPRWQQTFVDINCSAIPETLLEAELFGHQRGTFTGAYETRRGLFEEASGGTLFLDEVDALSRSAQTKLLRVLQERSLRRVGGRETIGVDIRIISATNQNLQNALANGAFRPDLYFRLCVIPIAIPPLSERSDDIPLLVDFFLQRHAAARGEAYRRFTPEAMKALVSYPWPGNVRELENAVEYALAISFNEVLALDDLPPSVLRSDAPVAGRPAPAFEPGATLAEVERRYITHMYELLGGELQETADMLGIDRRTLQRKLTRYGLKVRAPKEAAHD